MDSIISLLWQFQVQGIPIVPTILKSAQESPHHYFYSLKQNRVLRKKNPNAVAFIEQSQCPIDKQVPLLLKTSRNSSQDSLSLQLSTGAAASQTLNSPHSQIQYSIIPPNSQLILYTKTRTSQPTLQYLTVQDQRGGDWLDRVDMFVGRMCGDLVAAVQGKLAKSKIGGQGLNWVEDIGVVLVVDCSGISVVEVVRLQFHRLIQGIGRIRYKPMVSQSITAPTRTTSCTPKQQQPYQPPPVPLPLSLTKQQPPLQYIQCSSCSAPISQSSCKQIQNEEYKRLRKMRGLPIRGCSEEYYRVCLGCYQLL